jgi:hypothetical protein
MKRTALVLALALAVAAAQQPNTASASFVINGVDGPAFPITLTVQTNAPASGLFRGAANAPWALLRSPTGMLQPGAATFFGDHFDLPLLPAPWVEFDGFAPGSPYHMDASGIGSVSGISPVIGKLAAYQAVVSDPSSPFGISLTAASLAVLAQSWTQATYTLGDESTTAVNLAPLQIPFYGASYSSLYLCSNGYVTFGAPTSDFTPTPSEFNAGPPRIAPFWTDLDCPANAVTVTIDPAVAPNAPGLVRVDYTNVHAYLFPVLHNFSLQIHSNGLVQILFPPNNPMCVYDEITGIGPGGGGLTPLPQKDLSTLCAPTGSFLGGVNESFIEWYGIIAQNPYYGNPYDNPYDLAGRQLTFYPANGGAAPGSTQRYLMY